jgi:proteasome component ECM29
MQIVLREAKRKNPSYRSSAIKSLGDFADGFPGLKLLEETYKIVVDSATGSAEDAMDVDIVGGHSFKAM